MLFIILVYFGLYTHKFKRITKLPAVEGNNEKIKRCPWETSYISAILSESLIDGGIQQFFSYNIARRLNSLKLAAGIHLFKVSAFRISLSGPALFYPEIIAFLALCPSPPRRIRIMERTYLRTPTNEAY